MINVRYQHLLKTALELVVALGLVPYLLPGVGAELSARSKFGRMIAKEGGKDYQEEVGSPFVVVTGEGGAPGY